ncbi:zinc finger CCCH domain-containing protein 48-like isoform X2 [Gastrolobium bilobum]|uniref:zinc finger CCCH domain-containing protein 48-like isoform X2 n=1 Tax=Gastrolobium bilobum TaxID=150636 RepID=UPI002AB2508B|nr:zinc finger CCCH domain-containing protein 48-like isoform X2 [Gastrolobium bilobum]
MALKLARRTERISGTTCVYWLAGRCNRNPCRFLHSETPSPSTVYYNDNTDYSYPKKPKYNSNTTPNYDSKAELIRKSEDGDGTSIPEASQKLSRSVCTYWMNGNCVHGDQCCNLHSWFYGDGISALAKLHEHKKVVTGIALPVGSDKLYSGSTDGTVRMWDCNSGQCAHVINLGAKVTSLITAGPWVFVGIRNSIKAWNIQTASEFTLDGPNGQVLAMTFVNDTLLAGAEDGVISAWRCSSESKTPFELIASLRGHTEAVVCLCVGRNMLYSGSKDHSIKVWDLDTLQCERTLNGHTEVVTSLICWEQFLLSSSSDCTIKVWGFTKEETLEVIYTHTQENGVLALCGRIDAEAKPILYCSCRDNSVRMYDLPSFSERGRLFSQKDVRSLQIGPDGVGLFFTGDETGLLTVWKWLEEPKVP